MTLDLAAATFFDDTHTERVEEPGAFFHTFEFAMPADHPDAKYAVNKAMVVFPDLDGDIKAFVIQSVDEESSDSGLVKRCSCEDAAQEELLGVVQVPAVLTDTTAAAALSALLAGTNWQAGIVQTTATDQLLELVYDEYETKWECVLMIAGRFGLEVNTRVVVEGAQITARYIDLLQTRGTYTGQVLTYARDTASVTRHGDGGEIFTAAIGLGADGMTFAGVEWLVASGDPVNKPTADIQVSDTTRLEEYGIRLIDGSLVHRVGVFRDDEEDEPERLLRKTWAWLQERVLPQYTYDVALASLERMPEQHPDDVLRTWERLRVGDTVTVRDTASVPGYQDTARVIEIRRCYSDPTKDSCTLGRPQKRISDYIGQAVKLRRRYTADRGTP